MDLAGLADGMLSLSVEGDCKSCQVLPGTASELLALHSLEKPDARGQDSQLEKVGEYAIRTIRLAGNGPHQRGCPR